MPPRPRVHPGDQTVELVLARLLQAGVLLSAGVVLAGGLSYLARYAGLSPHYGTFAGEPDNLRHVTGIVRAARDLSARALIQLGLVLLIATPVLRVACSLAAFALQRDRTYVLLTAFVLLLLVASLAGLGS